MPEVLTIVGAIGIVKALVGIFTKLAADEVALLWFGKHDLEMLKNTLEMIQALLTDAANKQGSDQKAVEVLLKRLREIAYDAQDVIEEVSYITTRRKRRNRFQKKLVDFFSSSNHLVSDYVVATRVRHIWRKIDRIREDTTLSSLSKLPAKSIAESSSVPESRQTSSSVADEKIIGREDDKMEIIRLLITSGGPSSVASSSSSASNFQNNQYPERVSVVPIVGMGGVGKTTLAGLIYKDEDVKKFSPKIWVCVGGNFDALTVLSEILNIITGKEKLNNSSALDAVQNQVEEQLKGKKYLLVLDDMWKVPEPEWEKLTVVLASGHQDSKVLITARVIADAVLGGTPPYKLKQLRDEDCWEIIDRKVRSRGGALPENMISVGREIAEKCRGLPLVANSLGSLMGSDKSIDNWERIKEHESWNTEGDDAYIIAILKLNYDSWPFELKQCFSYCSIFRKNLEIDRVTLVQLWIAEGFLGTCDLKGKSIEDIANGYFDILVWSSFLDGAQKSLLDDIVTCKMHDLVHDLAEAVVGDQGSASLKVSELNDNDTSKIRWLQLILDVDLSSSSLKKLRKAKKLRTLFIPECSNLDPSKFCKNRHLHILHLGPSPNLAFLKLPSVGVNLKLLRYLRLTSLDLREVKNDRSISKLYNLETLVLSNAKGVKNLLSDIQSLHKLRYLELSSTDMVELPNSVMCLSSLETLDLNHSDLAFIPDSISDLKNLRILILSFNPIKELPITIIQLSNLETLNVNTCKNLETLPESVKDLGRLRIFDFENCPLLKALPGDFGDLTQLRFLSLFGTEIEELPVSCARLSNVEYVFLSSEVPKDVTNWTKVRIFLHGANTPILGIGKLVLLRKLFYLVPDEIIDEAERHAATGIEELENLNLLEVLVIRNLGNVGNPIDAERANLGGKKNFVELHLRWGETIDVGEEFLLPVQGIGRHYVLHDGLQIQVFQALRPPTCLKRLEIFCFIGSEFPPWMHDPSSLPDLVLLHLKHCGQITKLPASIGQLPRLCYLDLTGSWCLESLDGRFTSLLELTLKDAFRMEELSYSYPRLHSLEINRCPSLTKIASFPVLGDLNLKNVDYKLVCSVGRSQRSLTTLLLQDINGLVYFPISILQKNCKLQILSISRCNELKGFGTLNHDENDNVVVGPVIGPELHSNSLQRLAVTICPVLEYLPDLQRWTSLDYVTIVGCPLLKQSLTYSLKSLDFLKELYVDFIQRDDQEQRGEGRFIPGDLINLMEK